MDFYDYLMEKLLRNPIAFEERGDGNLMLREHVEGEPVERLRPLLVSDDPAIRRTAMFVANELGYLAEPLIDEITLLVSDKDLHVQWEAIEAIMGLSRRSNCERFVHVASALESSSMPICKLAMRLIIRANRGQIEAAINSGSALSESHKQGLQFVVDDQSHGTKDITRLLDSSDLVTRRYGAIVAVLNMENRPDLVKIASENSDEVVAIFATEAISDSWRHQRFKGE